MQIGSFDWMTLSPYFFTKARELMQLSTGEGDVMSSPNFNEFPYTFPSHYVKILSINTDAKKVSLNKIGKLLYFLTTQNVELVKAEMTTITPPSLMVPIRQFKILYFALIIITI